MKITSTSNTHQTVWLSIGKFITLLFSILNVAILARYLSKSDFGTYKQIIYIYGVLFSIFSVGLPSAYAYYLPKLNYVQGKGLINRLTLILFCLGLFFSFTLFFSSGLLAIILKNPELKIGLKYFSIVPLLMLPTIGLQGIYVSIGKTYKITLYDTISNILMLLFVLTPVILFNGTYLNAINGWIISSSINLFIALYLQYAPYKGIMAKKPQVQYWKIYQYCFPIMISSLYAIGIKMADTFFISRYYGEKVFAEYANGFIELPFVGMITSSVAAVLLPIFSKNFDTFNNLETIKLLFRSALEKSALLIYPLLVYCLTFSETLILLLYGDEYSNSIIYFRISIISNFFNIIMFSPLIFAMGATRIYSRIHLFVAIGVWIFEYISIHTVNSPVSISIISVLFTIIKIIALYYFVSRTFKLRLHELIPVGLLLKITSHSFIISILLYYILNNYFSQYNYSIVAVLSSSSFGILLIITSKMLNINYLNILLPLFPTFKFLKVD